MFRSRDETTPKIMYYKRITIAKLICALDAKDTLLSIVSEYRLHREKTPIYK